MFRRVSIRFAACILLMGGAPAMAADASALVSAGFSATGMGFRLIDLDPDDGIDPYWLHVPDFARTYLSANLGDGSPVIDEALPGTFFEAPTFEARSASGSASVYRSADSMTGYSSVTTADLSKLHDPGRARINPPDGLMIFDTGASMSNDFSGTSEAYWERTWILSPHTAVVFEGTAHVHASTDLAALAGTPQTGRIEGIAYADFQLSVQPKSYFQGLALSDLGEDSDVVLTAAQVLQDPELGRQFLGFGMCCGGGGAPLPSSAGLSRRFSSHQVWTDGQLDRPGEHLSMDTPFSFRIENTQDQELVGAILAKMWSSASIESLPTPVPEPGTGLFMGLGLAALAWGGRKRPTGCQGPV